MRGGRVLIEIVQGMGGHSLYVNRHRVAGAKPLAGGRVVQEWWADREAVLLATRALTPAPQSDDGKEGGTR